MTRFTFDSVFPPLQESHMSNEKEIYIDISAQVDFSEIETFSPQVYRQQTDWTMSRREIQLC